MKNLGMVAIILAIGIGAGVLILAKNGISLGSSVDSQKRGAPTSRRVTPLLAAVGAADIAQVRTLLEHGANPNDPDEVRSPLIQAITMRNGRAMRCDLEMVQLLLEHGANPNAPDPAIGALPLLTAFDVGDLSCAQALRKAGASPNSRESDGNTILTSAVGTAARSGDMSIIDVALEWGIDKDDQSHRGYTALHEAVDQKSLPVIEQLLKLGVDPCIKNSFGETPLSMAIHLKRSREIVDFLTKATACGKDA